MLDIRFLFSSGAQESSLEGFSLEATAPVHRFLASIPDFKPTPLLELPSLSITLGLGQIWVKDEAQRLGLKAFKAVGAVYAVAQVTAKRLGLRQEFCLSELKDRCKELSPLTFTTATDGNHGKAVAFAARELGQNAVVYLPQGASPHRVRAIEALGATAVVTEHNYDDAVRLAAAEAACHGWELIQDTAWTGYTEIPTWVMQGYTVIAREVLDSLPTPPTHVILQAGVGSFAGATLAYLVSALGKDYPTTLIAEPHNAACFYKSAASGDGLPHRVPGDLATIMAGLSCGEPNPIAWEIIRDYAHAFCSCPDATAELGMQLLARPQGRDPRIVAGESGAVGVGLLHLLMTEKTLEQVRTRLSLGPNSRVLVINTEGDTDPESYNRVTGAG